MIGKKSRYNLVNFEYIFNKLGQEEIVLGRRIPVRGTIDAVVYTIKEGDRLDLLAYKFYKSSELWWVIMDNNLFLEDSLNLPIGREIMIPYLG